MIRASPSIRPLLANHRRDAPGGHSATPFKAVPRSRTDANVGSLDLGAFVSQVFCASRVEPRLPPSCRFPRRTTAEYRTGHHIVHRPCRIATTSLRVHLAPRASRESMPQSWGLPPSLEVSVGGWEDFMLAGVNEHSGLPGARPRGTADRDTARRANGPSSPPCYRRSHNGP